MTQARIPTTVRELEHAAQFLTANVNVPANDRQLAGEIFRLFKSSGQAFALSKEALGATSNTYVIFQSVQALTAGLIRDWSSYKQTNPQLIREVTDYFLHLMSNDLRCRNVAFIQKQLCRSIALLCKKSLVSLVGNQSQTGFGEQLVKRCIEQLKQNISTTNEAVSLSERVERSWQHANILRSILEETQNAKNCRELACSVKSHLVAKKAFQRAVLPKLFEDLLPLTHLCADSCHAFPSSAERRRMLSAVLDVLETSFSWDYRLSVTPSAMPAVVTIAEESVLADGESTSLRPVFTPPYEFGRILFPPRKKDELLKFLFQLYLYVRPFSELAEKTAVCVVQMASLSGETMFGNNDVDHLTCFINCITTPEFSAVLCAPDETEIDNFAGIFSNLILYTSHSTYEKIDNEDLEKFVQLFAEVTVTFGLKSLQEHEDADNVGMTMPFSKAYADLLTTWQSLLTMYNSGLFSATADESMFSDQCFNMLQCFVHIHLAAPLGSRIDHEEHYVREEINEVEEADEDRFKDQLQVVGLWARMCLDKALPFLDTLLQQVMLKFEQNFWSFIQQQQSGGGNSFTTSPLYSLFEDVTWTMMIVANVTFPAENDDVEEIPCAIINYCETAQQKFGISTDVTCQYLNTQLYVAGEDADAAGVDPFIRFVGRMLRFSSRLMRQQQEVVTSGDMQTYRLVVDALSPQIVKETLLFVTKWIRVYTLPSDVQIHMLSTTLNAALKTNELCVSSQLEFALQMSLFYVKHPAWSSEPSIAEQAAQLVKAVCSKWTWGDKFNAQFFTESKAVKELLYELSRNNADDGTAANVLALRLNKQSLITLYQALTVAVVSIANFEDNNTMAGGGSSDSSNNNNNSMVFSGWGGGGGMVSVADVDKNSTVSQEKRHFTEKALLMWQHLISSVTKRFELALNGSAVQNRDAQWMLIIAALHASVGIVRAQLQHGTVATCKIFGLSQYIRDSSHHCSAVFDLWCQQQLASTPTMSPHAVNEVLLNFAPLLFEFYTTISDELLSSGSTAVNDAALQNNLSLDLHKLIEKWRFLLLSTVVGGGNGSSNITAVSRQLEHDETQQAYQDSFCACCKSLEAALSNLACLSIGVDYFASSSDNNGNDKERNAAINSLASHLVSSLTCVLDVVTEQALMLPAVSLALFTLINRFLNALPKRTIFTLISEQRFDRLMHALRHGIEIGAITAGGGVDMLLQTYEALSNVALEIAYAIGAVRSACAPLSRGFADIKAATLQQFAAVAGPMMATTGGNQMLDATMQLDAGQKRLLSSYMSNILELILTQLFGGQLPSAEVSGAMANAVYSLICCCRVHSNSSAAAGAGDADVAKSNYQNIFQQVLMRMVADDDNVRNRLAEHCMALFNFVEQKAVIRDGSGVDLQQLRVEKKLKIEFRDEIFSPLFTEARMLISVNLIRGSSDNQPGSATPNGGSVKS